MEFSYSRRIKLLYALCLAETNPNANPDLEQYDVNDASHYLACYLTFQAIRHAERSPADERIENFDMLSVYQAYAMLIYTYLTLPLANEGLQPNFEEAAIVIAKTIFAGLGDEEFVEIVESGSRKFQLIGDAEQEHWMEYRQDLDKMSLAFVIAGTDDDSPHQKEDLFPMFGGMLSILCEAFASE